MKLNYFFFPLFGLCFFLLSCNHDDPDPLIEKGLIPKMVNVDDIDRDYLVYVPEIYTGDDPVPLVFGFHGHGAEINDLFEVSKFYEIADKEGFIWVLPQGLEDNNGITGWDTGSSSSNDLSFVNLMIIVLSSEYNIDPKRVYASGFSNGAFFSFHLACHMEQKIAAIGAVSGYMSWGDLLNCNPDKPVPVLQIHGTTDGIVPYSGVQNSLDHWISHNNANSTSTITMLPDIDPGDGSTVEHYSYTEGDQGCAIEHFKVLNGGHQWPGLSGNMDIDGNEELWKFLSQYDINGKIE